MIAPSFEDWFGKLILTYLKRSITVNKKDSRPQKVWERESSGYGENVQILKCYDLISICDKVSEAWMLIVFIK